MYIDGLTETGPYHSFTIETTATPLNSDRVALPAELVGKNVARFTIEPPVALKDPRYSTVVEQQLRSELGDPDLRVQLTMIEGTVDTIGTTQGRVITSADWDAASAILFAGLLEVSDTHTGNPTWRSSGGDGFFPVHE